MLSRRPSVVRILTTVPLMVCKMHDPEEVQMSVRPVFRGLTAIVSLALVTPAFGVHAQAPEGRLSVDHYLDWEFVGSPQLSPDERQVVYERAWIDKINDQRASEIWLVNVDGSRNRFLLDGSGPAWSPA